MRLSSKPMRNRGARADRLEAWHELSRRKVIARCKGKCENCGDKYAGLDWCHLFSRRAILPEPLASCPQFTAGLCRTCHNAIDRAQDNDARERLRWRGIEMFLEAVPELKPHTVGIADSVDTVRQIDRILGGLSSVELDIKDLEGRLIKSA